MKYLLDTNSVSYIIKARAAILRRLSAASMGQIAISAITEGELRFGIERLPAATRLRRLVEEFLASVDILDWDSGAAQAYGILRADLEGKGRTMGNLDMLIAAHAIALGVVLVTNDKAFGRIKGLDLEDWTK